MHGKSSILYISVVLYSDARCKNINDSTVMFLHRFCEKNQFFLVFNGTFVNRAVLMDGY